MLIKKQKVKIKNLVITGGALTPDLIQSYIRNKNISVEASTAALQKVTNSHLFLNKNLTSRVLYGINTGFGPMADHILAKNQLLELQKNLILSHAVGMGDPIPQEFVLAAMIVRLNTLAKGHSGVSPALLARLQLLINKRIIPVIPEHGAVGTSGDLVQLAHIALALIGEGNVLYEGKLWETKKLFIKLKIPSYQLQPKEGLSLINGTSVMSGIGSLLTIHANRLIILSLLLGALALETVQAYSDSISEDLHGVRPHPGQMAAANHLRNILKSSKLLTDREKVSERHQVGQHIQELPEAIQEVYSLRCIAQIVGPILETYEHTKQVIGIEINSATDNPIIVAEKGLFLHGGNFHGEYVATALDELKAGMVKLTMLSERRTNFFLNNKTNRRFPPFMNLYKPGLSLALQGLQFVATSTTALSQTLGFPHRLHSIPTNGDNQDVVSMGTDGALLTAKVIDNAYIVLTIELITLLQAVDHLGIQNKLSQKTKALYFGARKLLPIIHTDRVLSKELHLLQTYLRDHCVLSL